MLKTFSAALIAVSVLAAPAMAGGLGHPNRAAAHSHVFGAKAQMRLHQHRHHVRPHVNFHKKFSLHKAFKHSARAAGIAHKHV